MLPGRLAGHLGAASWIAFAIVGLLLSSVALCFAEVSSMFRVNGGPYVYARAAFGDWVGFSVGWICWVTMLLGWSAVISGMLGYVGQFVPRLAQGWPASVLVVSLVLALAVINYVGVKPAAWTTNLFTIAKLVPLLSFVIIGAFHVNAAHLDPMLPTKTAGLGPAILIALFTLGGFEVTPVPAGETDTPERHIPVAMIIALLGAASLYIVIQIVAVGTLPGLAGSTRPLADAAAVFLGPGGATFIAIGAVISMTGFVSGSALLTPRYMQALAGDGFLPRALGGPHPRFGTPHLAIIVSSAAVIVCTQTLDFHRLVDLSVVAALVQFGVTCAAVPILRRKRPEAERTWRLRGGVLIPITGLSVALLIAAQARARDWLFAAVALAVGLFLSVCYRLVSRIGRRAG